MMDPPYKKSRVKTTLLFVMPRYQKINSFMPP